METIELLDIQPNQTFEKPLSLDGKGILLSPGMPLNDNDFQILNYWKIKKLYLLDEGAMPSAASTIKVGNEATLYDKELQQMHTIIEKFFHEIKTRGVATLAQVSTEAERIISMVKENKNLLLLLINSLSSPKKSTAQNALETTIYSIIMGDTLKLDYDKLKVLFQTSVMVNIGMLKMESILNKSDKLTPQEMQIIQSHPVVGFKIAREKMKLDNTVCLSILTHHENIDGSGYPRKLTGDKIPLYAKIIAVAQEFVALREDKAYRQHLSLYNAMRTLISESKKKFDQTILTCLLANMSLYPLGTVLHLNNDHIAVVVGANATVPLRPVIKVILDASRQVVRSSPIINLAEKKDLLINKVLNDEELQKNILSYL